MSWKNDFLSKQFVVRDFSWTWIIAVKLARSWNNCFQYKPKNIVQWIKIFQKLSSFEAQSRCEVACEALIPEILIIKKVQKSSTIARNKRRGKKLILVVFGCSVNISSFEEKYDRLHYICGFYICYICTQELPPPPHLFTAPFWKSKHHLLFIVLTWPFHVVSKTSPAINVGLHPQRLLKAGRKGLDLSSGIHLMYWGKRRRCEGSVPGIDGNRVDVPSPPPKAGLKCSSFLLSVCILKPPSMPPSEQ